MEPKHISWLTARDEIQTQSGKRIRIYELNHCEDEEVLNDWSKYFRNHYCSDDEIDDLRDGTGLTRSEYLILRKFPDRSEGFGPATRAGDFSEILIADYLEYILSYYVPRTRYDRKTVRNESTKGCDVIGFKLVNNRDCSEDDSLMIFEVKGGLVDSSSKDRLQDAVNDSKKDPTRLGESLNAIKQRLRDKGERENMKVISRFQKEVDNPYKLHLGAAALLTNSVYDRDVILNVNLDGHPDDDIFLVVIKGNHFMNLVHELYRRASIC